MKRTAPLFFEVEWAGPVALLDLDGSDPPLGLKMRRRSLNTLNDRGERSGSLGGDA
jgi:hypothetical protein